MAKEEAQEELEQRQRQEQMLQQKIVTEKECMGCKIISALFFTGLTAFQGLRVFNVWSLSPPSHKAFNLLGLSFTTALIGLNINAAVEIYKGKNMMLDPSQVRPGYAQSIFSSVKFLSMS